MCGNIGIPTATVVLKGPDGLARTASAIGAGPVDAAYKVWVCALVGGWVGWTRSQHSCC